MKEIAGVVPECLRNRPQWVAWRYVERGGKNTKAPVNPASLELAGSTDPSTWGTFDAAVAACHRDSGLAGVGFVFTADDPYCGVDLDRCRDADTGELKPWAAEFIEQLGSYTEVSPSGSGVKVFLKANKPGRRCRKAYEDGEVEVYDSGRFFTVTGQRLADSPGTVEVRQEALDCVYRAVFGDDGDDGARAPGGAAPTPAPSDNWHVQLGDDEIIDLASKQRRSGEKFRTLWDGDWNAYFNSGSEADSSVVFTLAFYTKDAAQIDRLFRRSGLMRPKWDELHGADTYGETTIAKALAEVTKQYKPKKRAKRASRPPAPEPTRPELPGIVIDDRQLSDLTDEAMAALLQANSPPSIFVRGGALTRVINDEGGAPRIESFDAVRMRCRLSEVANFFTLRRVEGEYEPVGTMPPKALAENLLAQTSWEFPALAGISHSPILRSDGTICTTPGYDPSSRLIYCPGPDLNLGPIPEHPCGEEIRACVDILTNLVGEFPYVDAASHANAMAILFTLLMRPVIEGHVPLAIVDAPMQGTGKSLLISALATIAVGNISSESIPAKDNDDEWRKKITSLLLAATPFILLDNIPDNTTINSPPLAAALTSAEWSDRLLGRNSAIRLPSRAVWVATGNNLRVAGDMPRRSYGVRLDANAERPWERDGFTIKELKSHVSKHRGDLLAAALTIVRGWYTNGCPKADVSTLGSFEGWAEMIGSVLAFAGIDGFLTNLEQTQTVQDEETQQWTAFFDAWWERFGSRMLTADDLCRAVIPRPGDIVEYIDEPLTRALPEPLLVNRDRGEGAFKRSLGRHLSRLKGRVFSGRKVNDAGLDGKRHIRRWQLLDPNAPAVTLFDMEATNG